MLHTEETQTLRATVQNVVATTWCQVLCTPAVGNISLTSCSTDIIDFTGREKQERLFQFMPIARLSNNDQDRQCTLVSIKIHRPEIF